MKFTAKKIGDTSYKIIELQEHFKEISDYLNDDEQGLDSYNFELLLESEEEILFAIRNNYRAKIYSLDLNTLESNELGVLGTENPREGDSLYLRAIDRDKIAFEYRLNDDENINGLYSILERKTTFKFTSKNDYDYLYLTDRYFLFSKDSFLWDDSKDEWVYNFEKDKVYLYDRIEDIKYEILDKRVKTSYHTSANHFVLKWNNQEYFLNFPFSMDPEDSESWLNSTKSFEFLDETKEISFIKLDLLVESLIKEEEIPWETLYSWEQESVVKPYFYENYMLETLVFSLYNLKNKNIKVLEPILQDSSIAIKQIAEADYSHLKTCRNIAYRGGKAILAHKDYGTEILSPVRKIIKHKNREVLVRFNSEGSIISGWSEDKDGSNYREYIKFLDGEGMEVIRLEGYYVDLKASNILIKI